MQSATETQQPNSSLPECWGRGGGRYKGEKHEEEMGPCNTERVFHITVPSELKASATPLVQWCGDCLGDSGLLRHSVRKLLFSTFVVRLESWIDHADCVCQWLEFGFRGEEGEVWW